MGPSFLSFLMSIDRCFMMEEGSSNFQCAIVTRLGTVVYLTSLLSLLQVGREDLVECCKRRKLPNQFKVLFSEFDKTFAELYTVTICK